MHFSPCLPFEWVAGAGEEQCGEPIGKTGECQTATVDCGGKAGTYVIVRGTGTMNLAEVQASGTLATAPAKRTPAKGSVKQAGATASVLRRTVPVLSQGHEGSRQWRQLPGYGALRLRRPFMHEGV